ncbi:MAG: hypothetical protein DRQ55_11085 [Planctomycetota bacterium]|nr:MAG: hypothetical protein DRQ55_11085 [Planctomycetota bacterium]
MWRSRVEGQCPICGTAEYDWGLLRGHLELTFVGRPHPFSGQFAFLAQALMCGGDSARVRRCRGCRNLQLFQDDVAIPGGQERGA